MDVICRNVQGNGFALGTKHTDLVDCSPWSSRLSESKGACRIVLRVRP